MIYGMLVLWDKAAIICSIGTQAIEKLWIQDYLKTSFQHVCFALKGSDPTKLQIRSTRPLPNS